MKHLIRYAAITAALLFAIPAYAQSLGSPNSTATRLGTQTADHVAFTGGTDTGIVKTGGTIDGTVIGGTTPAAASFTSVTSTSTKFSGSAPTPTGTGTPTIATGSTDSAGEVTAGTSATSVVITFAAAKTNAPFCTVGSQTQLAAFAYTISTTAITVTQTATSGNKIDYICVQH